MGSALGSALATIWTFSYSTLERVELPRKVIVHNIRLGLALRFLQGCAVIFVCWLILSQSDYVMIVSPTKSGVLALWDNAAESEYTNQTIADMASPFCTTPESYSYVYSASYRYENHTCSNPARRNERVWKEGDNSIFFVPTAFLETRYQQVTPPPGDPGDCSSVPDVCESAGGWMPLAAQALCECAEESHHFVTGVDALVISFDHGYQMSNSGSNFMATETSSSQRSDLSCEDESSEGQCEVTGTPADKTRELRTFMVVKYKDEERLLGYHDAPSSLYVPLADVLKAAGMSLNSPTPTRQNLLRCGVSGAEQPCRDDVALLPTIRQTGLRMNIDLQYSNRHARPSLPCDHEDCLRNHVGPLCKAVITVDPVWTSRPRTDCDQPRNSAVGDASCTLRYFYGINVVFTTAGGFGVIDPFFIILALGAGLVYLSVPLLVIHAVSVYLLGALSQVYWKAGKETVVLNQQLAGFVSRMITAQSAFTSVTGGDEEPLTKEMLLERIQQCLAVSGQSDLDSQEEIRLAELVMGAMDASGKGHIYMHDFVQAASCNDPIDLKDAIQLFDWDRKPWLLERLFTPRAWHYHKEVAEYFERDSDGHYCVDRIHEGVRSQRRLMTRTRSKDNVVVQECKASEQKLSSSQWLDGDGAVLCERQPLERQRLHNGSFPYAIRRPSPGVSSAHPQI